MHVMAFGIEAEKCKHKVVLSNGVEVAGVAELWGVSSRGEFSSFVQNNCVGE